MAPSPSQPLPDNGVPPKDIDLPATIVVYILVIVLGIGMCFCLRRANRLIPNRFSFPLTLRNNSIADQRRAGYNVDEAGDPEAREGLLSHYDDENDDEEDTRYLTSRQAASSEGERLPPSGRRLEPISHQESADEEFGALQDVDSSQGHEFDIGDSESEEEQSVGMKPTEPEESPESTEPTEPTKPTEPESGHNRKPSDAAS